MLVRSRTSSSQSATLETDALLDVLIGRETLLRQIAGTAYAAYRVPRLAKENMSARYEEPQISSYYSPNRIRQALRGTTVNTQNLAIDPLRLLRCQEADDICNIHRISAPCQRRHSRHKLSRH